MDSQSFASLNGLAYLVQSVRKDLGDLNQVTFVARLHGAPREDLAWSTACAEFKRWEDASSEIPIFECRLAISS